MKNTKIYCQDAEGRVYCLADKTLKKLTDEKSNLPVLEWFMRGFFAIDGKLYRMVNGEVMDLNFDCTDFDYVRLVGDCLSQGIFDNDTVTDQPSPLCDRLIHLPVVMLQVKSNSEQGVVTGLYQFNASGMELLCQGSTVFCDPEIPRIYCMSPTDHRVLDSYEINYDIDHSIAGPLEFAKAAPYVNFLPAE